LWLSDFRKFAEQFGDMIGWDATNRKYVLAHGMMGVDWEHYKHPLSQTHAFLIRMESVLRPKEYENIWQIKPFHQPKAAINPKKGFSTGFSTIWLFVSQEREASNDAKIKEVKRWVFLN
jgi:hypothetical protein